MGNDVFPLVSVIIPTKGCASTIERAISSVLQQDYPNIECLNVDYKEDKDSTFEVVKKTFIKEERVRYLKSDIAGLAYQRNLGVKFANGEFVVFLDGDDSIDESYISKMYRKYTLSQCDIVCCSYARIDENGRKINEKTYLRNGDYNSVQILKKLYSKSHTSLSMCTCKFAKKELYVKIPINEDILNEDEATTYKHFYNCNRIGVIDDELYNYFCSSVSTLSSNHLKRLEKQVSGLITVYLDRIELFKNLNNKKLNFYSYYELLNQTLSYAYVFQKQKNKQAKKMCIDVFSSHFDTKLLVLHPFRLIKLCLKFLRVKQK